MNELSNKKKLSDEIELKEVFGEPQFDIHVTHDKNNNTKCTAKTCDEETTNIKVVSVNKRLDIMENSLVDISSNLSSILTLQDTKHQVLLKEFKSLEKAMKPNVRNESNDKIYETQIVEKNTSKQIDTLRKDVIRLENDIRKSEIEHKKEFGAAKLDFQRQISDMRTEKTKSEIECEQMQSVMTASLYEIDNLRYEFERRLEEKDNMIRNLQDNTIISI